MNIIKPVSEGDTRAIGITCRLDSPKALDVVRKVFKNLQERKEKIFFETRIASKFMKHLGRSLDSMNQNNTKFIISVGGDGTILRVCQNLKTSNPPPLLGVNVGSVGFLDDSDYTTIEKDIDEILKGNYYIDVSYRLTTMVGNQMLPDALNEVLIVSSKRSKVLYARIEIDENYFCSSYLDGLIIATQTGSTAYALSAGGSLIDPRIKGFEIVPVNPFIGTGQFRPLLVPLESRINVILERDRLNGLIIIDGQSSFRVNPKIKVTVKKSNFPINFMHVGEKSPKEYYNKLRNKILLNRDIIDNSVEDDDVTGSNGNH